MRYYGFRFLLLILITVGIHAQENVYPWLKNGTVRFRVKDIDVPKGFERVNYEPGSFQDWLQNLPINQGRKKIRLYNGQLKKNQRAHAYIIDMDIGNEDLQQCADTVIRLYAEYLYSIHAYEKIAFHYSNGDLIRYKSWLIGMRPQINGNRVRWEKSASMDSSYHTFREYLNSIFWYAGSHSLSKELKPIVPADRMEVGDVFIRGGFPGHAMIVVDVAVNPKSGRKIFLLVQGYMPAQDAHVMRNLKNRELSPWFEVKRMRLLFTPEYNFSWMDLKRFRWLP
jgi:hypothetical protein